MLQELTVTNFVLAIKGKRNICNGHFSASLEEKTTKPFI